MEITDSISDEVVASVEWLVGPNFVIAKSIIGFVKQRLVAVTLGDKFSTEITTVVEYAFLCHVIVIEPSPFT